ncbi:cytochrome P450 CYP749A22-like [Ipomoea triloba]|uniref:cytochrome P450 CYP749A22-like n=1 Tax=Ipomoea triloba TaxID=35885 RepID=UPI00125E65CC|nr:cytochrome P450 CYP749A22-like [Ipomoea triloba]
MIVSSFFISLCLLIAARFTYKVIWVPFVVGYAMRSQGIKGPSYKFIYGNTKEVIQMRMQSISSAMEISHDILPRVHPHYFSWIKLYGANFLHWIGPKPQMVVTDPELIREVLGNKEGSFGKIKLEGDPKRMLGDGLAMTESDKWSKLRKLATQAFHAESLKDMAPDMVASVEEMLERWKHEQEKGKEIEVTEEFRLLTCEVISKTAFGSSYLEGKNIFEMLMKLSANIIRDITRPRFFGIEKLLRLNEDMESNRIERSLYESITELIRKREAMMAESGKVESLGSDFLGSLLKLHHHVDKENRISVQDIIDECKTFHFAGHETTNSLLAWVIVVLAIHTDWQEKARKEVFEICGQENPKPDAVQRLKTMSMIIQETSRLYAPVLTLLRRTKRKTKIGKLTIPAGVEIDIPVLAVHHNPEIWGEDAHLFNPDRFAEGMANATKNNTMAYFTFGTGPRKCVGLNFTILEVKIALTMILQRYTFILSPNYVHSPLMVLTLRPQHGVKILLRPLE